MRVIHQRVRGKSLRHRFKAEIRELADDLLAAGERRAAREARQAGSHLHGYFKFASDAVASLDYVAHLSDDGKLATRARSLADSLRAVTTSDASER